jgi:hypothetical protein
MRVGPEQTARPARGYILIMALVLTLGFQTLIILAIIKSSRTELRHIDEPPGYLLPGHRLPDNAQCTWAPHAGDTMLCRIFLHDNLFYLTYNVTQKTIVRTAMSASNETIGDLILAWGTPTGMQRFPWAVQVYWGTRSVYISARPFRPDNRTAFVSYNLNTVGALPWQGFAN